MSLLGFDGFDNYLSTADMNARLGSGLVWYASPNSVGNSGDIVVGGGRFGTNAYQFPQTANSSNELSAVFTNTSDGAFVGVAVQASGSDFTIVFADASSSMAEQVHFVVGQFPYSVSAYRGATLLGTSAVGRYTTGGWNFWEFGSITGTGADGAVQVSVNGDLILSVSGIDTQQTAHAWVSGLVMTSGSNAALVLLDDFYLCNSVVAGGAYPCDGFQGDTRTVTRSMVGDGSVSWTPGGTNEVVGTAVTGNVQSLVANELYLVQIAATKTGAMAGISFTCTSAPAGGTDVVPGLYNLDGPGGTPGTLVVQGPAVSVTAAGTVYCAFASDATVLGGVSYALALVSNAAISVQMTVSLTRTSSLAYTTTLPSTLTTTAIASVAPSLFATIGSALLNYQSVDELQMDSDTSFNYTSTIGNSDTLSAQSMPGTVNAVIAVQLVGAYRKNGASVHTVQQGIISGGTIETGGTMYLSTSYQYQTDIFPLDPATGVAWTTSGASSALAEYTLES